MERTNYIKYISMRNNQSLTHYLGIYYCLRVIDSTRTMGTLMPLVEQELLTLPGHLSSHSILMRLVLLGQTNKYHGENKLHFYEMMTCALYKINTLHLIFVVLSHWNNSLRLDMLLHLGTLSSFLPSKPISAPTPFQMISITYSLFGHLLLLKSYWFY
jgi:hypothetical protein